MTRFLVPVAVVAFLTLVGPSTTGDGSACAAGLCCCETVTRGPVLQ